MRKNYNTNLKTLLLLVSAFCFISTSRAQDNCKDALYESNKLFESGKIQDCITRLRPCVNSIQDKDQKKNAYHLLAQAYQNSDQMDSAKYFVEKLLLANPNYQQFPNIDPLDFNRLVNQYSVETRLYLGLKVGISKAGVELKKSYSVYESPQTYNSVTGYILGLHADYRLNPNLSVLVEVANLGTGINHVIDNAGGWKQNYEERLNYLSLNLGLVKYLPISNKLKAHIGLGIGINNLTSSNVFLETTQEESKLQITRDPIEERNRMQTSFNANAGVSYTLPKGIISLDVSYMNFLTNTVNAEKRTDDMDYIFNQQYINDDVRLRMMGICLTYKIPVLWKVKIK
jgi:hypothetical protein